EGRLGVLVGPVDVESVTLVGDRNVRIDRLLLDRVHAKEPSRGEGRRGEPFGNGLGRHLVGQSFAEGSRSVGVSAQRVHGASSRRRLSSQECGETTMLKDAMLLEGWAAILALILLLSLGVA